MPKIKILDENKELMLDKKIKNRNRKKDKTMKINDNLLEIGLKKGLIERDKDKFFFIGNYEKFLAFKRKWNN
jgi:hypothetical protein